MHIGKFLKSVVKMHYVGLGEGVKRQTVKFKKFFYVLNESNGREVDVTLDIAGKKDLEGNKDHDYFQILMSMSDMRLAVIWA